MEPKDKFRWCDTHMQYEHLVKWAYGVWNERWPDHEAVTIWASAECSNQNAQKQVKAGRKLRGKARYAGMERLECPLIVPISDFSSRGKKTTLTATSGAYAFQFSSTDDDAPFEVLYISAHLNEDSQDLTALALVPPERLETWAAFELLCSKAIRPRIRRRRDVYIIGGTDAFFDPTVDWEDVILPG